MNKSAVVLLSGGLDSCVAAAMAVAEGFKLYPLNIYYGQRHSKERLAADAILLHYTAHLAAAVRKIDLIGFGQAVAPGTILTDPTKPVPANRSEEEIDKGQAPSYVPGRNTILLAIAQAYAEAVEADVIYCGVNAVDYSGYADCRPEFIAAWNQLAEVATFRGVNGRPIWVEAPLISMSKADIVKRGLELDAPLELTWSCYAGGVTPCNVCDSCIIRNAAFAANGMRDPAVSHADV